MPVLRRFALWFASNAGSFSGSLYWRWRQDSPYQFGPGWWDVAHAKRRVDEAERGSVRWAFRHGVHYAVFHTYRRSKLCALLKGSLRK